MNLTESNEKFIKKIMTEKRVMALTVVGNSMLPTLHDGKRVTITYAEQYGVGDIVAYIFNSRIIIHRIYAISQNIFIAKGDNKLTLDPCLSVCNILGVVIMSSLKKYLYGAYKYNFRSLNFSEFPLNQFSTNSQNSCISDSVDLNKILVAICPNCANYNWGKVLMDSMKSKLMNLSCLEFHILDDMCIEEYVNGGDDLISYDAMIGVGEPILFHSLNDEQKDVYILSLINMVRQFIEMQTGVK